MFRKFFSYFIPINILTQKSIINKSIEVTWNNGELVLDTLNTNYSYGSLQRILKKGLLEIGFNNILKFQNILILGVAGGSVIKTLVEEVKFKNKIIGVEIDPEIIAVANKYFGLNKIKNLEIVIEDAEKFVKNNNDKYDLIIIDIFQDNFMPEFLFESEFIQNIISILSNTGFILFNTMVLDKKNELRNLDYINRYNNKEFKISKMSNLEKFNELIIINKF
jgi:spermidine synthase